MIKFYQTRTFSVFPGVPGAFWFSKPKYRINVLLFWNGKIIFASYLTDIISRNFSKASLPHLTSPRPTTPPTTRGAGRRPPANLRPHVKRLPRRQLPAPDPDRPASSNRRARLRLRRRRIPRLTAASRYWVPRRGPSLTPTPSPPRLGVTSLSL